MSSTVRPKSVRAMAAGAALASCSLAAAGVLSPMYHSSLNGVYAIGTIGSESAGVYVGGAPTNYMNAAMSSPNTGSGNFRAYGTAVPGGHVDWFLSTIYSTSTANQANFYLVMLVTLTRSAIFTDYGHSPLPGSPMIWTVDGNAVSNGDVIAAGTYMFAGGPGYYSGAPISQVQFGMALIYPASAVPLPGAAGFAAVGLVGLRSRRRR